MNNNMMIDDENLISDEQFVPSYSELEENLKHQTKRSNRKGLYCAICGVHHVHKQMIRLTGEKVHVLRKEYPHISLMVHSGQSICKSKYLKAQRGVLKIQNWQNVISNINEQDQNNTNLSVDQ